MSLKNSVVAQATLAGVLAFGGLSCANAIDINDVVTRTLTHAPNVVARELAIEAAKGGVQSQSGAFDTTINLGAGASRQRTPLIAANPLDEAESDSGQLTFGLSRLLANGMTISSEVLVQREKTNLQAFTDDPPEARATSRFSVTFPLLRGRGGTPTLAGIELASLELDAARAQYLAEVNRSLGNSLSAYWRYIHAHEALGIARSNEERAERLELQISRLVAVDEAAAAELVLVEASTSERRAARLAAEMNVLQSESALVLAMGLRLQSAQRLSAPNDRLPMAHDGILSAALEVESELPNIEARREDLRAAQLAQQSAMRQLAATRDELLPNLDLSMRIEFGGLREEESYSAPFSILGRQDTGPSANMNLEYSYPVGRNRARGQVARQVALRDQAQLELLSLQDQIATEAQRVASDLRSTHARQHLAHQAELSFEQAVNNERRRYGSGMSTIINLLEIEDRYANARQNTLNARLEHALALTNYLVGTAQLIQSDVDAPEELDHFLVQLQPFTQPQGGASDR